MMGISLGKILFTALVIFLVWLLARHGKRILSGGQPGESRTDRVRRAAQEAVRATAGRPDASQDAQHPKTVDLVRCESCGSYIPRGTKCTCGRSS
jgi:hypothetical protein